MKDLMPYILDLRNVKCPMNLVLVKQAFFENTFANGGKILVENDTAKKNIIAFLVAKNVKYLLEENVIFII